MEKLNEMKSILIPSQEELLNAANIINITLEFEPEHLESCSYQEETDDLQFAT